MPFGAYKEDEKFYYVKGGRGEMKVAKSGLSAEKKKAMAAEIPQAVVEDAAFDSEDELPKFTSGNSQAQQMSLAQNPAVLGVNVNAPPLGSMPNAALPQSAPLAPNAQPAGTMDLSGLSQGMGKTQIMTESTPGIMVSPEERKNMVNSYDQQIKAANDFTQISNQAQIDMEKENTRAQVEMDQINYERSLIEERRQFAANDAQAKLDTSIQEFNDSKVDPERFFGGSTGKRVLAGIAIAFGEVGKAFTGSGSNAALQIINKAIDDDIASQNSNISKLGQNVGMQRQLMSDLRSKFQDADQAQLAQKAALLEASQRQIGVLAGRVSNAAQQQQAQALIGSLEGQKQETIFKLRELSSGKSMTKTVQEFGGNADQGAVSEQISKYRSEWRKDVETAKTLALRENAQGVTDQLALKTKAGDLAAIILLAKTLDPASVVREGEIETLRKTGGAADYLVGKYNSVMGAGSLNDNQRKEMNLTVNQLSATREKSQSKRDAFFIKGLPRGIDSSLIVEPATAQISTEEINKRFFVNPQRDLMKGR